MDTPLDSGSWWAYRELGCGGWWFWDPVENASFMPWLVGTALLHSLMVSEKRQQFLGWTLLLAITAFSLSLVGTFLVRSGVLTSVHAFAVDPQRGLYILIFLCVVIGGSLLLFACRAQTLQKAAGFVLMSRESVLLLNNVFLTVTMLTVLMGTVYPLLIDGLNLGKLSVGAPYFNTVFIPLMVPVLILMGFGIHVHWQKDHLKRLSLQSGILLLISLIIPVLLLMCFVKSIQPAVLFGLMLACWVIFSTFAALLKRLVQRGIQGVNQSFMAMVIAHVGIGVSVIGIAVSSGYGLQDDVKMEPGTRAHLAGFQIEFVREMALVGENYHGSRVEFLVESPHRHVSIYPEKRIYNVGKMPLTESAIDVTPFRDVYISLGEPLGDTAWSVRLYYKPFVRWIWWGGALMVLGGLVALTNRRYYSKPKPLGAG